MPAANMLENLQPPALQVPEPQGAPEGSPLWSSSSTPTLRRRRFKMRRMKNVQEQSLEAGLARDLPGVLAPGKEFLQLPSIEITPSSDEDTPWSNCSTPSASPRRKRFLLRKWLRVRERKECSESSKMNKTRGSQHLLSPYHVHAGRYGVEEGRSFKRWLDGLEEDVYMCRKRQTPDSNSHWCHSSLYS
ncbi:protein Aster-B isoform X4 [Lynx canadensis]|uniref:protein Aster-B isoform X4 n=2 Tax=Felinae TaxID=338152 RepID=UPI0011AFDF32|nr:protein Aster-B isoform X4 [Lynx canadensis]